jgi:hypothetical protein
VNRVERGPRAFLARALSSTGTIVVTLRLEDAQTLAIGPFNPHIITPDWLVKNEVCEEEEVEMRFAPMSQGTAFNFKKVKWQIDYRSLMVSSGEKNCGNLLARAGPGSGKQLSLRLRQGAVGAESASHDRYERSGRSGRLRDGGSDALGGGFLP